MSVLWSLCSEDEIIPLTRFNICSAKSQEEKDIFKAKQIKIRILKFGKDFDADVWLKDLRLNFDQMNSKVEIWY